MENFIGALAILIIPAPFYFYGVRRFFKWWDKRKKKGEDYGKEKVES